MSDKPLTYQGRCLIQAIKHMAHGLGCIALGDGKGAVARSKAVTAWLGVAAAAKAAVIAGVPQQLLDATWVEPLDYLDELPTEFEEATN